MKRITNILHEAGIMCILLFVAWLPAASVVEPMTLIVVLAAFVTLRQMRIVRE